MVYGRHIQSPQLSLAEALIENTPSNLNQVYFLSSGSEAVEAALKIARLFTDRYKIFSAANAYHGSTIGAESLRSDIDFTLGIAPLVPGIEHITFNDTADLERIDHRTAAVIMETVQAEAGVKMPSRAYMKALRRRCTEVGALLILDEIQVGLGRTGKLFAFEHYDIFPDILVLGKAIGGGLPLSAVMSDKAIMSSISTKVPLAHLTTFGGHPLCCSAGLATLTHIVENQLWLRSEEIGHKMMPWIGISGSIVKV
jgi:acetylornithine/succinyldiaminopimelate/putrescine aminotransferase